jgi:hypothetical protein
MAFRQPFFAVDLLTFFLLVASLFDALSTRATRGQRAATPDPSPSVRLGRRVCFYGTHCSPQAMRLLRSRLAAAARDQGRISRA